MKSDLVCFGTLWAYTANIYIQFAVGVEYSQIEPNGITLSDVDYEKYSYSLCVYVTVI